MKVFLISLGCARNLVDSEYVLDIISREGYEVVDEVSSADIAIVNTCGFIGDAKEESIDIILDLVQIKETKDIKIVVGGCFTQKYSKELLEEIPEVDAVIGINWDDLIGILKDILKGERVQNIKEERYLLNYPTKKKIYLTPAHFAYLKISEGCSHRCSYCAIYNIKGSYRSRPLDDILKEAEFLVGRGVRELNVVAQDTTSYGVDLGPSIDITSLLRSINDIEGDFWIRLLYTHPQMVGDDLISCYQELKKLCKYLDLPLQHISSKILKEMNRPASREVIFSLIKELRERVPGLSIRTSFIVGFPGESEEDFNELIDFIKDIKFDRLGCFRYSREDNTDAFDFEGQISESIKDQRFNTIMKEQNSIARDLNNKLLGKEIRVLVEEERGEYYLARSEFDAPEVDGIVYIEKSDKIDLGAFINVRVKDVLEYDLIAEIA
ncbi:MAG: 30S ribosomal protein S12 methylthiotransferase RimO [Candidatus Kaelpia aquatica]|nr:30S ribosomal protein S12 methylthiotransferase RimO [Candidatus Kaelpia aquatica]